MCASFKVEIGLASMTLSDAFVLCIVPQDICVPMGAYRTMLDEDHVEDLKHFQKRSKSWNGERQSRIKQNTICRRSSISELHGSKS